MFYQLKCVIIYIDWICTEAFGGFDPEIVATFNEKKIAAINAEYGLMDVAKIRGMVENAKQIPEVRILCISYNKNHNLIRR